MSSKPGFFSGFPNLFCTHFYVNFYYAEVFGKDSVCLNTCFLTILCLREMFEERSFFKMETERSKQLCFDFALLVLILEL